MNRAKVNRRAKRPPRWGADASATGALPLHQHQQQHQHQQSGSSAAYMCVLGALLAVFLLLSLYKADVIERKLGIGVYVAYGDGGGGAGAGAGAGAAAGAGAGAGEGDGTGDAAHRRPPQHGVQTALAVGGKRAARHMKRKRHGEDSSLDGAPAEVAGTAKVVMEFGNKYAKRAYNAPAGYHQLAVVRDAQHSIVRGRAAADMHLARLYDPVRIPATELLFNNPAFQTTDVRDEFRAKYLADIAHNYAPDYFELANSHNANVYHAHQSFDYVDADGRDWYHCFDVFSWPHSGVIAQTVCPRNLINYVHNYRDAGFDELLPAAAGVTEGDKGDVGADDGNARWEQMAALLQTYGVLTNAQCWVAKQVAADSDADKAAELAKKTRKMAHRMRDRANRLQMLHGDNALDTMVHLEVEWRVGLEAQKKMDARDERFGEYAIGPVAIDNVFDIAHWDETGADADADAGVGAERAAAADADAAASAAVLAAMARNGTTAGAAAGGAQSGFAAQLFGAFMEVMRRVLSADGNLPVVNNFFNNVVMTSLYSQQKEPTIRSERAYNYINFEPRDDRRFREKEAPPVHVPAGFVDYRLPDMGAGDANEYACLPSVYVAGCPKCGSSNLYDVLMGHPALYTGKKTKESHFWDRTYMGRATGGQKGAKFSSMADWVTRYTNMQSVLLANQQIVEGSPNVMTNMLGRFPAVLHKFSPHAKVLLIVRDPVRRYVSDFYYMGCHSDMSRCDETVLLAGIRTDIENLQGCIVDGDGDAADSAVEWQFEGCAADEWGIFERLMLHGGRLREDCEDVLLLNDVERGRAVIGLYAYWIERWAQYYRYPQQLMVLKMTDLDSDAEQATMDAVFDFVGVETVPLQQRKTKVNSNKFSFPLASPEALDVLERLYNPWNCYLKGLLGDETFVEWNTPGIAHNVVFRDTVTDDMIEQAVRERRKHGGY